MTRTIKSASLFLACLLFILTVFSAPVITDAAVITTVYINGDNVRVRSTPTTSTNSNIIEKIGYTSATLLEKTTVDNSVWLKISYIKDGITKEGYIYYDSSYIELREYDPDVSDKDFETLLNAFPESYHKALRELHAKYPNWKFIPDPVSKSFKEAVAEQSILNRKVVNLTSHPISWRSMGLGAYNWSTKQWSNVEGGWTGASKEVIAYYMDPRNFLNENSIYMFMEQSYNASVQNESGVQKIINGTFMTKDYTPASGEPGNGSYLKVIMLAAAESGVNPYIIASKIKQEQGVNGTSPLISGTYGGDYNGYYNFFNVQATGSDVVLNGLKYAVKKEWNSRYKSILGGAQFLANSYISKGQDTYYYQDFNVHGNISRQYATAVHDAYSKGSNLASTYQKEYDMSLSFRIPVFADMPATASPMPVKNDKRNNYYLDALSADGLTPSFDRFTYNYSLKVRGNAAIKAVAVSGASISSNTKIALKKGDNTVAITVKAETGYTNDYVISVNADSDCTLYITSDGKLPANTGSNSSGNTSGSSSSSGNSSSSGSSTPAVTLGDTNGDGKINIVDLAKVQMHILNVKTLSGSNLTAADVNKDGKINIVDLARVQMHILKVKLIGQ